MEKNAILIFEKEKLDILKEELTDFAKKESFEEVEIFPGVIKISRSYNELDLLIKEKLISNALFVTEGVYSGEIDSETFYSIYATEELQEKIDITLEALQDGSLMEGFFKKDQIYPIKKIKENLYLLKTINSRQAYETINYKKPIFLKEGEMFFIDENTPICFLGNFKKIIDL